MSAAGVVDRRTRTGGEHIAALTARTGATPTAPLCAARQSGVATTTAIWEMTAAAAIVAFVVGHVWSRCAV